LESALYLRLLWPNKETSGENMKKKELIIETITNFIITNDQVTLFFDKTREAQRNVFDIYLKVLIFQKRLVIWKTLLDLKFIARLF